MQEKLAVFEEFVVSDVRRRLGRTQVQKDRDKGTRQIRTNNQTTERRQDGNKKQNIRRNRKSPAKKEETKKKRQSIYANKKQQQLVLDLMTDPLIESDVEETFSFLETP